MSTSSNTPSAFFLFAVLLLLWPVCGFVVFHFWTHGESTAGALVESFLVGGFAAAVLMGIVAVIRSGL